MKYVRTKDGRIIDLKKRFGHLPWCKSKEEFEKKSHTPYEHYFYLDKETSQIFFYNCYNNCRESIEVVKQSDTIEELIDEYVVSGEGKPYVENDINFMLYLVKTSECNVYGEIWVDDELRKVAKMNEKGELELL